jgi:hypothetical protein
MEGEKEGVGGLDMQQFQPQSPGAVMEVHGLGQGGLSQNFDTSGRIRSTSGGSRSGLRLQVPEEDTSFLDDMHKGRMKGTLLNFKMSFLDDMHKGRMKGTLLNFKMSEMIQNRL